MNDIHNRLAEYGRRPVPPLPAHLRLSPQELRAHLEAMPKAEADRLAAIAEDVAKPSESVPTASDVAGMEQEWVWIIPPRGMMGHKGKLARRDKLARRSKIARRDETTRRDEKEIG